MVHPEDLRYFKAISQTSNMTRASERLGVSQPTLTHAMKRLEAKLGCTLLIRSQSGVRLTKAGLRLLELADELESSWGRIRNLVSEEVELVEGTYTIGCHASVGLSTIHRFLGGLLREHPKLNIRLRHGLSREIVESISSNRLDLGIIANPMRLPGLTLSELCQERFALWKSPTLKNPEVLIYDPDLAQVEKLIDACSKKGITFRRHLHSSSLELTAKLTSEGAGIGILPERVLEEFGGHSCEPVEGAPIVKDRICLVFKKENQTTAASTAIIKAIQSARY